MIKKFLLDGNIYNRLESDATTRDHIVALVDRGHVLIVASPVVVAELRDSPFAGMPSWFPVKVEPEGIAISGMARSGMARSGTGAIYRPHLGSSTKGRDAIIAQSAQSMGAILVSDDRRCRERLKTLTGKDSAMTYEQLATWVGEARRP